MQKAALVLIRFLGVLCVLYALILLGTSSFIAWPQFIAKGAGSFYSDTFMQLWMWSMIVAVLALYIAWLLWFELTPLNVRRLGFFVGFILWQWCCLIATSTDPPGGASDGWPAFWRIGWPIGCSMIVGTVVSHGFRRCLFPVVTPPTRLERWISRSTESTYKIHMWRPFVNSVMVLKLSRIRIEF
jgi:hypothetical protein